MNNSIKALSSRLKEIPGCTLEFKLYSQRQLLKGQRLLSENEVVGRYDVIAGLQLKDVGVGGKKGLACIGDELIEAGGRSEKKFVIPANPIIEVPFALEVANCKVRIRDRLSLEAKIVATASRSSGIEGGDGSSDMQIIQRVLKIGKLAFSLRHYFLLCVLIIFMCCN